MYALGKRSEQGKALERAVGLRLDLRSAVLIGCDLSEMDFSQSLLGGVKLSFANLSHSDISETDLRRTDFSESELECADFIGAICWNTNFSKVRGTFLNFSEATLSSSDFKYARWSGPNLSRATVMNSEFANATFEDANLSGTYFRTSETDLAVQSQKYGITQAQLDEARSDPLNPPQLNGLLDSETLNPLVWRGLTLGEKD